MKHITQYLHPISPGMFSSNHIPQNRNQRSKFYLPCHNKNSNHSHIYLSRYDRNLQKISKSNFHVTQNLIFPVFLSHIIYGVYIHFVTFPASRNLVNQFHSTTTSNFHHPKSLPIRHQNFI